MTRRLLAKVRPLDADAFNKIRARTHLYCPYCGREYRLSWIARWMERDLKHITCRSCEILFLLPMNPDFDPTNPLREVVDAKHGVCCKSCRVAFRVKHRYEQCPGCGQVICSQTEDGRALPDNSEEFGRLLSVYRSGT